MSAIAVVLRAPLSARTRRDLAYAGTTLLPAIPAFAVALIGLVTGTLSLVGLGLPLLALTLTAARKSVDGFRIPAKILDWDWPKPRPILAHGRWAGFRAVLRDRLAWRALLYGFVKLPMTLIVLYLTGIAIVVGSFAVTSPGWWLVPRVREFLGRDTWTSTWVFFLQGVLALLAVPWLLRLFVGVDAFLVRNLLTPGRDRERIAALEESRTALAADAVATLRRIERDLHDGTQARLVSLGIMLSRLEARVTEPAALGIVDSARRSVGEGLDELREIIRGMHPPALDAGLPTALATLASRSAVPTELIDRSRTPPPAAAASTIYFAAAELLANVARHAHAGRAWLTLDETELGYGLTVVDDGNGGARQLPGRGLDGLSRRAEAIDGSLRVDSPDGGPTTVSLTIPKV